MRNSCCEGSKGIYQQSDCSHQQSEVPLLPWKNISVNPSFLIFGSIN